MVGGSANASSYPPMMPPEPASCSATCNTKPCGDFLSLGVTCLVMQNSLGCECEGCCPARVYAPPMPPPAVSPPPVSPPADPACGNDCNGRTCLFWQNAKQLGVEMTCSSLTKLGCDCSGCCSADSPPPPPVPPPSPLPHPATPPLPLGPPASPSPPPTPSTPPLPASPPPVSNLIPACNNVCSRHGSQQKPKTCLEWFQLAEFTCAELKTWDVETPGTCACDGCCVNAPPPPPAPPAAPPPPLSPPPPPFYVSNPLEATLSALAIMVGFGGIGALLLRLVKHRLRRGKIGVVSISSTGMGNGIRMGGMADHGNGNGMRSASETELSALDGSPHGSPMAGGLRVNDPPSPDDPDSGSKGVTRGGPGSRMPGSLTKRAERYKRIKEKKVTHRKVKGVPLAASDGDHTMMFGVTSAWRAAIRDPAAGSFSDVSDESSDVYGSSMEVTRCCNRCCHRCCNRCCNRCCHHCCHHCCHCCCMHCLLHPRAEASPATLSVPMPGLPRPPHPDPTARSKSCANHPILPHHPSTSHPSASHPSARQVELRVELMLEAFTATLGIAETFGPLMGLAVKNDQANFEKVRGAWAELSAADPQRCSTLRGLLEAERSKGIHKAGGVLADPSAAIALVWMRRSLDFQTSVLDGMVTDRHGVLLEVARGAYKTHLESYHNFWLKNTFRAGLSAMPRREEFLQRLSPALKEGLSDEEREAICYSEMGELVEVQQKVIATMSSLFVELDLEDNRKA